MRSARLACYRTVGQLRPTDPTPGGYLRRAAAYRDARAAGYSVKNSLVYVYTAYATTMNTDVLRREFDHLIAQRAHDPREEDMLRTIHKETGRLSLYSPRTNFEALMARAKEDASLMSHVKWMFKFYREAPRETPRHEMANEVLRSPNAEPWRKALGFTLFDGQIVATSEIGKCAHCQEPFLSAMRTVVIVNTSYLQEAWCPTCAREHSTACDVSGQRFANDANFAFERTEGGLNFCVDYCTVRSHRVYRDEEDNLWYVENTEGARLPGYHGSVRPWAEGRGSGFTLPKKAIGVELEIGFKGGDTARSRFLGKHMKDGGRIRNWPFSVERDGSLDGNVPGGCEIISDPLPFWEGYAAPDSHWRKLLELLNKSGAQGWKHRVHAGIHVNMDVRHVTREDVFKFAIFISNCAALSKFIAGRKKIFGRHDQPSGQEFSMYTGGYTEKKMKEYSKLTPEQGIKMIRERDGGKYSPVHFRNNECLEVRIFGSNIKYEGFMACVEYCAAAMEYVQTLEISDVFNPILSSLFRHWLAARTKQFPNLSARIGLTETPEGEVFKTKLQPVKECA
jgi:hypothetical protein